MKILNYFLIAGVAVCMMSCGGKKHHAVDDDYDDEEAVESVEKESDEVSTPSVPTAKVYVETYEGSIGKYPILMTIQVLNNGNIIGAYTYTKVGNKLYLKGNTDGMTYNMDEFTPDGYNSGTFRGDMGVYEDGSRFYTGTFVTAKGKSYEFNLDQTNVESVDFTDVNFDEFYTDFAN